MTVVALEQNALYHRQLVLHKYNARNVKKFLQGQHVCILISMFYYNTVSSNEMSQG
jgi:hypothetical protein